jgi:hypothetical protein
MGLFFVRTRERSFAINRGDLGNEICSVEYCGVAGGNEAAEDVCTMRNPSDGSVISNLKFEIYREKLLSATGAWADHLQL